MVITFDVECARQGQDLAAMGRLDARQAQGQFCAVPRGEEIVDTGEVSGVIGRRAGLCVDRGQALEEPADRATQGVGGRIEFGSADAVGAQFVFLQLLEGDAERIGHSPLADVQQLTCQSQASSNVAIDGMRVLIGRQGIGSVCPGSKPARSRFLHVMRKVRAGRLRERAIFTPVA